MQKLQQKTFLSHSRVDTFNQLITNRHQNFVVALTLNGPEAQFFGKDLSFQIADWQVADAQELHHQLLDLMKNCRLKKLNLQFALSLKLKQKLVLACLGGQIWLQRHGQQKNILQSQTELAMILGNYQQGDQLTLLAGGNQKLIHLINTKDQLKQKIINQKLATIVQFTYQEVNKTTKINNLNQKKKKLIRKIQKNILKIKEVVKKIKKLSAKQRKKLIFYLIIAFSLILALIIALKFRQQIQNNRLQTLQTEIDSLVLNQTELATLSQNQPILAREKIAQNQILLEELLAQQKKQHAKELVIAAINDNLDQAQEIASENNLDRLSVYYDWRAENTEFLGQKILVGPQGIVISSDQSSNLLWLDNQQQLQSQEIEQKLLTLDLASEELAFFSKNNGLQYFAWGETARTIKEEGDSDRAATLAASYQNYLYLVNPEKRNIYRYTWREEELSEAIGWLVDKTGVNFKAITDISVNGDLWLTFSGGKVMKFSRGYQEDFAFQGLSSQLGEKVLVSSREDVEKIVFLDKNERRLIVTMPDGQVISEIKSNELAGVSDIELAIDGQSVFALSGSVIYQIQL